MDFYDKKLLDHFKNPRYYGSLKDSNMSSGEYNPSCGDSVLVEAKIENEKIQGIAFTGKGCAISMGTASILMETCIGKELKTLLELNSVNLMNLIGMSLGLTRMRCALLPLIAIQNGILVYSSAKKEDLAR